MRRRAIIAGLILASYVTGAFGTPPPPSPRTTITYVSLHDVPLPEFVCTDPGPGFWMQREIIGTAIQHEFRDKSGRLQKVIYTQADARMIFTNLTTGESVTTPTVAMVELKYDANGNITRMSTRGLTWRIVVPGKGLVTADVGRIDWTYRYDSQGNPVSADITFKKGIQNQDMYESLCRVLG